MAPREQPARPLGLAVARLVHGGRRLGVRPRSEQPIEPPTVTTAAPTGTPAADFIVW